MPKFKGQVVINVETEAPNREALQAVLSTGVSYNAAVGGMVTGVQVNVAPASKILGIVDQ